METNLNVKDAAQLTQIQLIDEIISRTENKKWAEESMMHDGGGAFHCGVCA